MSRATLISRVVFALLVVATFTAFFAAQRLKRSDSLVYSVNLKRYVSPNGDGVRERARLRFRTKKDDVVTVEVINRNGAVVRTLADRRQLRAGVHKFYWNGRYAPVGERRSAAVPDGAYRVRIAMRDNGRTFIPDKFFVVDTGPPQLSARVVGGGDVNQLSGRRRSVTVVFTGVSPARRAEFLVYRVEGRRALSKPVAGFMSTRGKATAVWNLTVGETRLLKKPCVGHARVRGRPRPAPSGDYVIVARACDAAGNTGLSSSSLPPRPGSSLGSPGVSLRGVQIAPRLSPIRTGNVASFDVNPPPGGYSYRLVRVGGGSGVAGRARGARLRLRMPSGPGGLYALAIKALRPQGGANTVARAPVVVAPRAKPKLLVVYPAIAWQATNPVDVNGDGFGDTFVNVPAGERLNVPLSRMLATPSLPRGFSSREGAIAEFLASGDDQPAVRSTTDLALAADPDAALKGVRGVLFAGDQRWITTRLGVALKQFVTRGGNVGFFAPDAFRRGVRIVGERMSGPSARRQRDIFGQAIAPSVVAPAPVVPFADQLGLFQAPAGQFIGFEQSRSLSIGARTLTSAGREAEQPAFVGYRLGKGLVISVGVEGWQAQTGDPNVAYTTRRILIALAEGAPQ